MLKILIIIFIILSITCVSFYSKERFSEEENEDQDQEEVDVINPAAPKSNFIQDKYSGKYQQLDRTINYLDNYYSSLYNNLHFFSGNVNNLLKESPVNKLKLTTESPTSPDINQTYFESLDYKKALIDAARIQNFEDIYLYKMNQLIN